MTLNSKVAIKVFFSLLVLFFVFSSACSAYVREDAFILDNKVDSENNDGYASVMHMLPINAELSVLMKLLKQPKVNSDKIEEILKKQFLSKMTFNAAEKYLHLVAQALVITKLPQVNFVGVSNEGAVSLLTQADKLSVHISDKQLSQPDFLQLHLILADHYGEEGKYDLAYLEKAHYLERYHIYREDKRLLMISTVEKSFEVKNKKANNALLKSKNALKVRRVAEIKDERETQQYNFTIIISTALVFVLLFFRQLKVRNKLISLTLKDPLTQVANRSALFEKGKKLVAQFSKEPDDLSVLLLDLDHFKQINDNFGHNVGDKVLVIITELIQETMRSRDVFARLGGEEFVALLPYADTHKAKAIAMRINEKIAAYDFSSIMIQKKVTISIGIVTLISNKMFFDDLLHCADLAMYQAKEKGRNAVVCYEQISVSRERRVQA